MHRRSKVAKLLGLVIMGCAPTSTTEGEAAVHPDDRYRTYAAATHGTLPLDSTTSDEEDHASLRLDSLYTIDAARIPNGAGLGRVGAVVVDRDDLVHLLDDRLSSVIVVGPDGEVRQRFGRPGNVPGELAGPVTMAAAGRSRLYVGSLDHSISVFDRQRGRYQFVDRLELDVAPQSLCVMGRSLFVNAPSLQDPHVIVAFDVEGRRTNAFGETYNSPNPAVNHQLRRGRLACDADRGIVVFAAATALGEIRAFRPSGQPMWSRRVDGIVPIRILDDGRGGYQLDLPPGGYHRLNSLISVGVDTVLLQYVFVEPASMSGSPDITKVESVLINTTTGALIGRSRRLPPLSAIGEKVAVTSFDDPREPTPRAVVWKRGGKSP